MTLSENDFLLNLLEIHRYYAYRDMVKETLDCDEDKLADLNKRYNLLSMFQYRMMKDPGFQQHVLSCVAANEEEVFERTCQYVSYLKGNALYNRQYLFCGKKEGAGPNKMLTIGPKGIKTYEFPSGEPLPIGRTYNLKYAPNHKILNSSFLKTFAQDKKDLEDKKIWNAVYYKLFICTNPYIPLNKVLDIKSLYSRRYQVQKKLQNEWRIYLHNNIFYHPEQYEKLEEILLGYGNGDFLQKPDGSVCLEPLYRGKENYHEHVLPSHPLFSGVQYLYELRNQVVRNLLPSLSFSPYWKIKDETEIFTRYNHEERITSSEFKKEFGAVRRYNEEVCNVNAFTTDFLTIACELWFSRKNESEQISELNKEYEFSTECIINEEYPDKIFILERKAAEFRNKGYYHEAIDVYRYLLKQEKCQEFRYLYYILLGECYRLTSSLKDALESYSEARSIAEMAKESGIWKLEIYPFHDPEDFAYLARLRMSEMNYLIYNEPFEIDEKIPTSLPEFGIDKLLSIQQLIQNICHRCGFRIFTFSRECRDMAGNTIINQETSVTDINTFNNLFNHTLTIKDFIKSETEHIDVLSDAFQYNRALERSKDLLYLVEELGIRNNKNGLESYEWKDYGWCPSSCDAYLEKCKAELKTIISMINVGNNDNETIQKAKELLIQYRKHGSQEEADLILSWIAGCAETGWYDTNVITGEYIKRIKNVINTQEICYLTLLFYLNEDDTPEEYYHTVLNTLNTIRTSHYIPSLIILNKKNFIGHLLNMATHLMALGNYIKSCFTSSRNFMFKRLEDAIISWKPGFDGTYLVSLLYKENQWVDRANDWFRKLEEEEELIAVLSPEEKSYLYQIEGKYLLDTGNISKAIELLEKSTDIPELDRKNTEVFDSLRAVELYKLKAYAYTLVNDYNSAKDCYEHIISLINNEYLHEDLERIKRYLQDNLSISNEFYNKYQNSADYFRKGDNEAFLLYSMNKDSDKIDISLPLIYYAWGLESYLNGRIWVGLKEHLENCNIKTAKYAELDSPWKDYLGTKNKNKNKSPSLGSWANLEKELNKTTQNNPVKEKMISYLRKTFGENLNLIISCTKKLQPYRNDICHAKPEYQTLDEFREIRLDVIKSLNELISKLN